MKLTKNPNYNRYPHLFDEYGYMIDTTGQYSMPYAKSFITENGNQELCNATGVILKRSPDMSDWWYEYEDSNGNMYYGR